MKISVAKFKSKCNHCSNPISKGDGIIVDKRQPRGKRSFCSNDCADLAQDSVNKAITETKLPPRLALKDVTDFKGLFA